MSSNPLLDLYHERLAHARTCDPDSLLLWYNQPSWTGCLPCRTNGRDQDGRHLRQAYAWAVPDDGAIELIAKHAPNGVVEIGAGLGYWARLLQERGVHVAAYDIEPEGNHWCEGDPWTEVLAGGPSKAAEHPDLALLLCWPPYNEPMAHEAEEAYAGDTLIYIGEDAEGCTGDRAFHIALGLTPIPCYRCANVSNWVTDGCDNDFPDGCDHPTVQQRWTLVETYDIPQWAGLHDRLFIFERLKP